MPSAAAPAETALRVLSSRELAVAFAPELGMLATSLRHGGEELLGPRGVPLLHPWANRLGGRTYRFAGRAVALNGGTPQDENGLPIHGLLAAVRGWTRVEAGDGDDHAWLAAELHAPRLDGFPFPHTLRACAELRGAALTITTTLRPTADVPVPVSFGYHPYLRLPGVPRHAWEVELPIARRLATDARGIPTGRSTQVAQIRGRLGRRTFDDGYVVAPGGEPFALSGGGRRIEVSFDEGYPCAQVFAPATDDVVCFEPMTAPTDALRGLHGPPPRVEPGDDYRARFTIRVEATP